MFTIPLSPLVRFPGAIIGASYLPKNNFLKKLKALFNPCFILFVSEYPQKLKMQFQKVDLRPPDILIYFDAGVL